VRVPLAAEADNGHRLAFQQSQIRILVVVHALFFLFVSKDDRCCSLQQTFLPLDTANCVAPASPLAFAGG
jgi:hypothetical protein